MADEITTRRALEVVLSRCKMDPYTQGVLARALSAECKKPEAPLPPVDREVFMGTMCIARDYLQDVGPDFSKKALLGRIEMARTALVLAINSALMGKD